MMIFMHTNARRTSTEFRKMAIDVPMKAKKALVFGGYTLRTRIQRNASGRPGPNVITGDYRRSWAIEVTDLNQDTIQVEVGTNEEQGYQLEFGRIPFWPPYPHVGPASDETEKEIEDHVALAVPK